MRLQHKLVCNWYRELFKFVKKNIDKLHINKSRDKLSLRDKTDLKILEKSFDKSCSNLSRKIRTLLLDDMSSLCEQVVEEVESKLNVEVDESVTEHVIDSIILGLIYNTEWTLTDAIDRVIDNNQDLIHTIIQDGISSGKSAEEIAQDILDVLDPNSNKQQRSYTKKDKTIYVGMPDYRAQRLVRTTLEHTFQKIIAETAKDIEGKVEGRVMIRWISALAPNTCEVCESRHGKLYTPEDLPLEHPNGQCDFEIEIF